MVDFTKVIQAQRQSQRKKSFSDEICQTSYNVKALFLQGSSTQNQDIKVEVVTSPVTPTISSEVEDSEKNRVMSSLKEYMEPLLKQNYSTGIEGGEIVSNKREDDFIHQISFSPNFTTWNEYLHSLAKCQFCQDRVFAGVVHEFSGKQFTAPLDVLFVSDRPREFDPNSRDGETTNSVNGQQCFQGEKGEMVKRMIQRMELADDKTALSFVVKCVGKDKQGLNEIKDICLSNLLHEIYFLRPKVIVAFGAWCSEVLRGKSDKLSTTHGQFYPLQITTATETISTMVVPLFHPDLLFINNDMKKTTWMDMQKIMNFLMS